MYTLPVGEVRPYFSFEGLARRVTEAHVSDNAVLRHTSVANKWKSIHLLLHPGHNATQLHYNLTFQKEDSSEFTMSFTVAVDTREVPQANVSQSTSEEDNKEPKTTPTPEPLFLFSDVPEDKQGPKIHKKLPDEVQAGIEVPPVNMSLLPADVQSELQKLEEKLVIGDITLKGFNLTKAKLLKSYLTPSPNDPESQSHPAKIQRKDKVGGVSTVVTLLPVPIDDDLKKDFAAAKHSSTDAPIMRLLTSKLRGSVPKVGGVRSPTEAAAAAVVGRRLQHFTSADRGFLPWERRKYFQKVLEVKGSISENCFNIRGPTGIYSRTSFLNSYQKSFYTFSLIVFSCSNSRKKTACRTSWCTTPILPPPSESSATLLPTPCVTSTSCWTASLGSRRAKSRPTCLTWSTALSCRNCRTRTCLSDWSALLHRKERKQLYMSLLF